MNILSIRQPEIYRSTLGKIIKLAQASPGVALFCIGATALVTASSLMLLLVLFLE
jgi:hypothetical protein